MPRLSLGALALLAAAAAAASAASAASEPDVQAQAEAGLRDKRYVAALARNGELPLTVRREWRKKLHPAMSAHRGAQASLVSAPGKRYLGSLARAGQMPGKRTLSDEMNDAFDEQMEQLLLDEITAIKQLQNEEKLLQEMQEERSPILAAYDGNLYARNINDYQEDEAKRGISTLAKNGQLPAPLSAGDNRSEDADEESAERKRGGVAALARLGYLPPHKKDLDWLLSQLRPAAAAADKRNVGALARGGGFSVLGSDPADEPQPGEAADAGAVRAEGAAALTQHLKRQMQRVRQLLERRHELLQLQRYERILLPHVVRR